MNYNQFPLRISLYANVSTRCVLQRFKLIQMLGNQSSGQIKTVLAFQDVSSHSDAFLYHILSPDDDNDDFEDTTLCREWDLILAVLHDDGKRC